MKTPKIDHKRLYEINTSCDLVSYFGPWFSDPSEKRTILHSFRTSSPFEHVVINNFFSDHVAETLFRVYPTVDDNVWHKYFNPIEVKYAMDDLDKLPKELQDLFYILSTATVIQTFQAISRIEDLTFDPYLHGAGLHCHPRYGRLNIHLDYERHPVLKDKERRLNLIIFMTKDWDGSWGGQNELWDSPIGKERKMTPVGFNKAILFRTNNISWHGLPRPIQCPQGVFRKSIAYYYLSPLVSDKHCGQLGDNGTGYREKATFIRAEDQEDTEGLQQLLKIRTLRRITTDDIQRFTPDWDYTKIRNNPPS